MKESHWELWTAAELTRLGIEPEEREHIFSGEGEWRTDFAWPSLKIALEVEGHGHSKWNRYHGDVTKYNELAFNGYRLFRLTFKMINDGQPAVDFMERFAALIRREQDQRTIPADGEAG